MDEVLTEFLRRDFCFDSLMTSHYPGREVFNADASCALPGLLIEALVDAEPGRVELLPAVPASMPAGRLRGVRTVARVTILELRWDLGTGSVEAVLRSDLAQLIRLVCNGESRTIEFAAHTPLSMTVAGDGGVDDDRAPAADRADPSEEKIRMVTLADVARAAGVSASTVSYVLSGKRPISRITRGSGCRGPSPSSATTRTRGLGRWPRTVPTSWR